MHAGTFTTLLPLASWFLVFSRMWTTNYSARAAILNAAVCLGVVNVAFTEILSAFHMLTFEAVRLLWVVLVVIQIVDFVAKSSAQAFVKQFLLAKANLDTVSLFSKGCLLAIGICVFFTGVVAIVSAPNNYDAMTYHMPRVVHWIQDRNVGNYPTNILRQLTTSPGAEFGIAQLMLLSGGDFLSNIIQYGSYLGCIIGASELAKLLGGSTRQQMFSALAVSTLPLAILQASSTQNDLVVSFWLTCLLVFGLELADLKDLTRKKVLIASMLVGFSLGLVILTKGTGYFIAFPIIALVFIRIILKMGVASILPIFVILLYALILNSPYYMRNMQTFGMPLDAFNGGKLGPRVTVSTINPLLLTSNAVRNLTLQFASPFKPLNVLLEKGIGALYSAQKLDVIDKNTTYMNSTFDLCENWLSEDYAGAPLYVVLILVAMSQTFNKQTTRNSCYAVLVVAMCVCLLFALKWQPWHVRLELPLLILACPLIAMHKWFNSRTYLAVLASVLFVLACPVLVLNDSRPLIGEHSVLKGSRYASYFAGNETLRYWLTSAIDSVAAEQPDRLGLVTGADACEYMFWAALKRSPLNKIPVRTVCVENVSAFCPEWRGAKGPLHVVIAFSPSPAQEAMLKADGFTIKRVWGADYIMIFTSRKDCLLDAAGTVTSFH